MRVKSALGLCAVLLVSPVLTVPSAAGETAKSCGWTAQVEDDEGGQVMVASSCESDTEYGPVFRLMCGGEVNIRYYGLPMEADLPTPATLVLSSEGQSLSANVVLEEMDGALAAYVEKDSPIIALLKSGAEVGVTVEGTDLPSQTVSLQGSTAAIDQLIGACR